MTTKEPKLDDILTHLLPVEQRIVRTHDEDVTALASRAYNGSRPEGNPRKHRDDTNKKKGPCHYCGKLGHHKAECRKRIRDEAQHKSGGNRGVALTACTCTHGNAELDLEEWIIDSGASRHITFCKDILLDSRPLDQDVYITFGNGATVQAESVGTVQLKTKDGPPITLSNVLCVPGATHTQRSRTARRRSSAWSYGRQQRGRHQAKPRDGAPNSRHILSFLSWLSFSAVAEVGRGHLVLAQTHICRCYSPQKMWPKRGRHSLATPQPSLAGISSLWPV